MRTLVLREIAEIADALSFRRKDLLKTLRGLQSGLLASTEDDPLVQLVKARAERLAQLEYQLGEVIRTHGEVRLEPGSLPTLEQQNVPQEIPREAVESLVRLGLRRDCA
jgi:hypothetical protein